MEWKLSVCRPYVCYSIAVGRADHASSVLFLSKFFFFFFFFLTGKRKRKKEVLLVEFMYLVFTRMPGESHCRRLRSLLLYLCHVFRALINSLAC